MDSSTTAQWLALILQATPGQFKSIKALSTACEADHGHPLGLDMALTICGGLALDDLTLKPTAERDEKLADFVYTTTPPRIEWIDAVKATQWDSQNWSSEASQLFMTSESLGISGTVAYAVITAAMTIQGFKVPHDLNTRLYGAKQNMQRQVKELVAAEKRRAAELAAVTLLTSDDHAKD